MNSIELQSRLKNFAYRVVKACEALPKKKNATIIEHQILRSFFQQQQIIGLQQRHKA